MTLRYRPAGLGPEERSCRQAATRAGALSASVLGASSFTWLWRPRLASIAVGIPVETCHPRDDNNWNGGPDGARTRTDFLAGEVHCHSCSRPIDEWGWRESNSRSLMAPGLQPGPAIQQRSPPLRTVGFPKRWRAPACPPRWTIQLSMIFLVGAIMASPAIRSFL